MENQSGDEPSLFSGAGLADEYLGDFTHELGLLGLHDLSVETQTGLLANTLLRVVHKRCSFGYL